MRKYSASFEYILVIATACMVSVLNSIHVWTQWIHNPSDRVFIGISHYYADYFLYLSQVYQGYRGHYFFSGHMFTNEPMRSTWIYWFNVLSGFIGGKFGMPPYVTYTSLLFLIAFILVLCWYVFSYCLYPDSRLKRLLTFFIILSATSGFDVVAFLKTGVIIQPDQYWFSPHPAINRFGGVPHQMFQTIIFISILLYVGLLIYRHQERVTHHIIHTILTPYSIISTLILSTLTFLGSSSNPQQMLILIIAFIIYSIIDMFTLRKNAVYEKLQRLKLLAWIFLMLGGVSFPTALLVLREFTIPVFSFARIWESAMTIHVSFIHFLFLIGPSILFIPFGIFPLITNRKLMQLFFILYGVLAIAVFFSPIPGMIHAPASRFMHPAPYGIIGLFACEGMLWIASILKKIRIPPRGSVLFLIFLYGVMTVPVLVTQIKARANPDIQNPGMLLTTDWNHVPKTTMAAFTWLEKQPDIDMPVVMMDSEFRMEILIPVIAGKVSFSGHPLHTLYFDDKEAIRTKFFTGKLSPSEIRLIMDRHRIGWIVTSQKTDPKEYFSHMPFLSRVYENDIVRIYAYQ